MLLETALKNSSGYDPETKVPSARNWWYADCEPWDESFKEVDPMVAEGLERVADTPNTEA